MLKLSSDTVWVQDPRRKPPLGYSRITSQQLGLGREHLTEEFHWTTKETARRLCALVRTHAHRLTKPHPHRYTFLMFRARCPKKPGTLVVNARKPWADWIDNVSLGSRETRELLWRKAKFVVLPRNAPPHWAAEILVAGSLPIVDQQLWMAFAAGGAVLWRWKTKFPALRQCQPIPSQIYRWKRNYTCSGPLQQALAAHKLNWTLNEIDWDRPISPRQPQAPIDWGF